MTLNFLTSAPLGYESLYVRSTTAISEGNHKSNDMTPFCPHLNISLLSTNCIENVFKNLRRHIGRVSRWRENTTQGDRWMASGLILAAQGFHRIKGHGKPKELIKALEIKIETEEELKEVA